MNWKKIIFQRFSHFNKNLSNKVPSWQSLWNVQNSCLIFT